MIRATSLIKALGAGILIMGSPAQGEEQAEVSLGAIATREESGFDMGVRIRRYLHSFIYNWREGERTPFLPPSYRGEEHAGRSFRYGVGYESRTGPAQAVGGANSIGLSEGEGAGMNSGSGGTGSGGGGGGAGAGGGGSGR